MRCRDIISSRSWHNHPFIWPFNFFIRYISQKDKLCQVNRGLSPAENSERQEWKEIRKGSVGSLHVPAWLAGDSGDGPTPSSWSSQDTSRPADAHFSPLNSIWVLSPLIFTSGWSISLSVNEKYLCCFKLKVALFYRGCAPETERHEGPLENAQETFPYSKLGNQTNTTNDVYHTNIWNAMKEFNHF